MFCSTVIALNGQKIEIQIRTKEMEGQLGKKKETAREKMIGQ